jgi:hypothetical protein
VSDGLPASERDILLDIRADLARVVEILDRAHAPDRTAADARAAVGASGDGARPVAEAYLRALAEGDATTANRLSRVNTRWPPNDFLRQEVYEHAEHLTEPRFISPDSAEVEEPRGEVRYPVSYHLAGETVRDWIRVTRDDDEWWVSEGLVCPLPRRDGYRGDPAKHYSLPGARFGVEGSRGAFPSAYVGVYTVMPPNRFYAVERDTCAVLLSRNRAFFGDGTFAVVPNDAYVSLVQRAVDETFDAMTSAGTIGALREAGMRAPFGLSAPPDARVTSIAVLEPPVVAIGDSGYQEFTVSEARVMVSATGANFREEIVTEDIIGTFHFTVTTSVSCDDPSIRVTR